MSRLNPRTLTGLCRYGEGLQLGREREEKAQGNCSPVVHYPLTCTY